ncbi:MAG: DNA/RNA nuclease SfsA [Myxococcales bacterium]|nr:DNA/RNA nuclease SfsA [Myxococcales bacterium]
MKPLVFVPHPTPLSAGRLLGRRKRFFADVRLDDGSEVVAHCVNTGKMEGLLVAGRRVYLSPARPGRKLAYTWELLELESGLLGVNTIMANRLVRATLEAKVLRGLRRFSELRSEYPYGDRSRVDFWLGSPRRQHFVEVKNCHLVYPDRRAYFPDARSERGTRHLGELTKLAREGHAATVIFIVQRSGALSVRPSDLHDPELASAARCAAKAGVRFRALAIRPTLAGYAVLGELPVDLAPYDLTPLRAFRDRPDVAASAEPSSVTRAR